MKLPGTLELDDEVIKVDGNRIIHLQIKDSEERIPAIVELELIPEINFVKGLLIKMCDDFQIPIDQPIVIASSDINQLSYILGLMIGLQNGSISTREYENSDSFHYLGELNNVSLNNLNINDLDHPYQTTSF